MKRKLLFITNHPSPHMADLFRAIHAHEGLELLVAFAASSDPARSWSCDRDGFPSLCFSRPGSRRGEALNASVANLLRRHLNMGFLPIVCIYTMRQSLLAMLRCTLWRRPWVFMGEAPGLDYGASRLKQVVRDLLVRTIATGSHGIVAISRKAVSRYRSLSCRARVEHFQYYMAADQFRAIARKRSRRGACPIFLFCGSLYHCKNPAVVVRASELLTRQGLEHDVVFAGDGILRGQLECQRAQRGLSNIRFVGQIDWASRHEAFAEADVLVHPSAHDGWGMVIAEALAAGMPVIATDECGAGVDFIKDGENGFLLSVPVQAERLAQKMAHFIRNPADIGRMGAGARASVKDWTPENGAEGLYRIICEWFPEAH